MMRGKRGQMASPGPTRGEQSQGKRGLLADPRYACLRTTGVLTVAPRDLDPRPEWKLS